LLVYEWWLPALKPRSPHQQRRRGKIKVIPVPTLRDMGLGGSHLIHNGIA
jgi:hypothetical protein